MSWFSRLEGQLKVEDVLLSSVAEKYGTPCYVYSRSGCETGYNEYKKALEWCPGGGRVCYAVKANSNLSILSLLADLGSGFEIVSVGELERVLAAGGEGQKVVFCGVCKEEHEIRRALEVGIFCFNVESEKELELIQKVAESMKKVAPISLRVNPDIDPQTHPYISTGLKENKFGIESKKAVSVYQKAAVLPNVKIVGIACHIGSQILTMEPLLEAFDCITGLVQELKDLGITINHIDIGGGLGVRYSDDENPPSPSEYLSRIKSKLLEQSRDIPDIIVQPGRSIVAPAGVLVTRVNFIKETSNKSFAIIDASMTDLLRPSLYGAYHKIEPVDYDENKTEIECDVVGPVCESGDFIGKKRRLRIIDGDLIVVYGAGAYGHCMSSNYNSRNRPAEVLVDGNKMNLVRRRETIRDQLQLELTEFNSQ
ncbi:PREDICTED: uncharacterized protein LOC100633688 [Amphimedon queenslandica]|uniref:diaminopimelate decarboxylase n=1 Tax=Amphimedon queenslandica TaxID=400682 RepID=A0A1X7UE54_AMPQE|nr:PREDICTED: uncharacterized protein LOC100633688 [Amphimedon queenslandica]|eukprot:XP_011405325.1 PREDICTED: uncharacterized protein LOC100633688 [Amphimedon queenslandica]